MKGAPVTGPDRKKLAASIARRYNSGQSIRTIAHSIGRSYGFVHSILAEQNVAMRRRGGGR